jgi:hypothetical protein
LADTDVAQFACSWEILAVLVERDRHDTVCCVKGFLHSITMVDIDIDIQDSLLESEEFDDAEDDVYL